MPAGKEDAPPTVASLEHCHQTSVLRTGPAQPDTLLAPEVPGRPSSPALAVPGARPSRQWHVIGMSLGSPQHSSGGRSRCPQVQQRRRSLF